MTINQILEILKTCSSELEILNCDSSFKKLQDSDTFNTCNDLTLTDALQAIYEIESAIQNLQQG